MSSFIGYGMYIDLLKSLNHFPRFYIFLRSAWYMSIPSSTTAFIISICTVFSNLSEYYWSITPHLLMAQGRPHPPCLRTIAAEQ